MARLMTMVDSSWSVVCSNGKKTFWWRYDFKVANKSVVWKDEHNGRTGKGRWEIKGGKLVTTWLPSKTVEWWNIPIYTDDWSGTCKMDGADYNLTAKARNYDENTTVVYFRTKEEKAALDRRCSMAFDIAQHARNVFGDWFTLVGIAYRLAYLSHKSFIEKEISATQKLAQDAFLNAALAILGGAVGGAIGGQITSAVREAMSGAASQGFMIDGVKDLAKYSVRATSAEMFRAKADARMPTDPETWKDRARWVVDTEIDLVEGEILAWRQAIADDEDQFDADFDPVSAAQDALYMTGSYFTGSIFELPPIATDILQWLFERGFLAAWITTCGKDVTRIPVAREAIIAKLRGKGQQLGLANIDKLLADYIPDNYYDLEPKPPAIGPDIN